MSREPSARPTVPAVQAASRSPGELQCGRCGRGRRRNDRFCSNCGLPFEDPVAERKYVTLMFADLCGSTAEVARVDPEEAQGYLDRALGTMAEAVDTYGGVVHRLQGDGIVGVFGAPLALEDHALRACLAALAIQRRMRERPADRRSAPPLVRIGIHSGEVVVGSIDKLLSSHPRLDGAAIHLAARLEEMAAPGSVLLSLATARLLDGALDTQALGPRKIRGFDTEVELHLLALDSERSAAAPLANRRDLSPLVGREQMLATLRDVALRVARGRMCVVGVRGDAGIGKSRLVVQFGSEARDLGFRVCAMGTRSYTSHLPYSTLADLMRALMGLQPDIDPNRERERGRAAVAGWGPSGLRQLDAATDLLDLAPLGAEWLALTASQRRARIGEAFLWLVRRQIAEGPLMIVVEDVHRADRDSLRMLESIWRLLGDLPVLLCVSYRQDFVHRWAEAAWFEEHWIGPLPQKDMLRLADALLGRHESLVSVLPALLERADGNPFFLEQMSLTLVDNGALVGSPGAYRYQGGDLEPRVSSSIASIVGARVDRLTPAAKATLESMAILDETVSAETLGTMTGRTTEAVERHLRLCRDSGLLVATPAEADAGSEPGPSAYAFRHALVQEVVAAALTRPRRQLLHRAAFHALTTRLGARARERASVLARHAYQGGAWVEAAQWAVASMARSIARSANRDALRVLDLGLDAASRIEDEPTRLAQELALRTEALGALMPLGHFDAMFKHLEHAKTVTERLGDPRRQAAVSLQMAVLLWTRGMYAQGLDAAADAARAADVAGSRAAQMTAAQAQLMLDHGLGRYGSLVARAREVELRFAAELGARRIMQGWAVLPSINVKVFLADALARMGDIEEAQKVCDLGYDELRTQDQVFSRLLLDVSQVTLWLRSGRHREAIDRLRVDLSMCREHDIPTMMPSVAGLLAEALGRDGQTVEACALAERMLFDRSYLLGGRYNEFYLHYGLGLALATAGQHGAAREQLGAAQRHAASYQQHGHEADALLALGETELLADDPSTALLHLRAAAARAQQCSMRVVEQQALQRLATLGCAMSAETGGG